MSAELQASRRDATLILTLSNPGMGNMLHADMAAAAIETISTAERDDAIKAVVITGANNVFSRGIEIGPLLENRDKAHLRHADTLRNLQGWIDAIKDCPKPVIAAVEYIAAGAGFSLALACDFIVAGASARFAMPQIQAGLPPDGGGSWFIAHAMPKQLAAEVLLGGGDVDATRLHAIGIVNRIVNDGGALDAALFWADELARLPADVCEQLKTLLREAQTNTLSQQFESERLLLAERLHQNGVAGVLQGFLGKQHTTLP